MLSNRMAGRIGLVQRHIVAEDCARNKRELRAEKEANARHLRLEDARRVTRVQVMHEKAQADKAKGWMDQRDNLDAGVDRMREADIAAEEEIRCWGRPGVRWSFGWEGCVIFAWEGCVIFVLGEAEGELMT